MAGKKRKSTRAESAKRTKERSEARRQVAAILMLLGSALLMCIAIIPGENLWTWLHNVLLGLFSFCAYVVPLVVAFVAVIMAWDRENKGTLVARAWESGAFVVMLSSLVYTFAFTADIGYGDAIAESFQDGLQFRGGGVLGALLGWPVEKLFGDVGAKIILILLMLAFLMLVTGTTVMGLLRAARRPVEKTKETIETAMVAAAERRKAAQAQIDIDLGEGYPKDSKRRKKPVEVPEETEEETPLPVPAVDVFPEVKGAGVAAKKDALTRAAADLEGSEEAEAVDTAKLAEEIEQEAEEKAAEDEEAIYRFPPLSLLDEAKDTADSGSPAELEANGRLLVSTLKDFGISTRLSDITYGPAVTRYELEPSAGVKISRITGLADDIALRLATSGVRIEAPIPNKAAVGIEVPNKGRKTVCLRSLLDTPEYRMAKGRLTVALGQDIEGETVLADLAKMPHLLIAGTTGSGKSVCTNSMIQSVLFHARPDEVKMILIDPKQVEFGVYNGVPHLLVPVVTDPRKAAGALSWAVNEMLKRYQMFAASNVRDISGYNEMARNHETLKPLPLILIVIDELADLMMAAANEVEDSICRLAQMARAAGMHMVIATQRPSVDVITGLIKANIPSRLALTVASAVDSRTILDSGGAERLLGYGDMLFMPVGQSKPRRVQGCFVSNHEVERVVEFLKKVDGGEEYDQEIADEINKLAATGKSGGRDGDDDVDDEWDEALPQAIEIAVESGQISTSMLQRKMRFGYARAGRIMDQMEQKGIVGPSEGSKPRKVLITRQQWIEMNMNTSEEE